MTTPARLGLKGRDGSIVPRPDRDSSKNSKGAGIFATRIWA